MRQSARRGGRRGCHRRGAAGHRGIRLLITLCLLVVLCLALLAGALPARAAAYPTAEDRGTVHVQGVEQGATVRAYRIVESSYAQQQLAGFGTAAEIERTGIEMQAKEMIWPDADTIERIAAGIGDGSISAFDDNPWWGKELSWEESGQTWTASLPPGLWLVLVSGGSDVYNPMLVGIYYTDVHLASSLQVGTVSATGSFKDWNSGEVIYAKRTSPGIDNRIVLGDQEVRHDDVDVEGGADCRFHVSAQVPAYSDSYFSGDGPTVEVKDTLDEMFSEPDPADISVSGRSADGSSVELVSEEDYVITVKDRVITLSLTAAGIQKVRTVEMNFTSSLSSHRQGGFVPSTTSAVLRYTQDHEGEVAETGPVLTRHYSFDLDSAISGDPDETKTLELAKAESGGTVQDGKVKYPVGGALFTLTGENGKVRRVLSSDEGLLSLTGLDAGVYTLQEVSAPAGYTKNDTIYTVTVTPTYSEAGILTQYCIEVSGEGTKGSAKSTYTASYEKGAVSVVTRQMQSTVILNTTSGKMAETGGGGTIVLTALAVLAGGAMLLWGALARRKGEE